MFYTDSDFQGGLSFLLPGTYPIWHTWDESSNDAVTSVRCLPPEDATAIALFEEENFRGDMRVLFASRSDLSIVNFNDKVSSAIVTGGTWKLYEHTNYEGQSLTLEKGYQQSAIVIQVSSVKLL